MTGVKPLRKIQWGREATAGTPVAATTPWRGNGTAEDMKDPQFVEEDVGILPGTDRTYIPKFLTKLELEPIEATFEQIAHLFEAGIKTISPVQDGAGSDYIYAYALPTTAQPTLKSYTIESGDDQQAEEFDYCLLESIKIAGKGGEALMMSGTWFGRESSTASYTGAISLPTVEEILFSKGSFYVDPIGGTIGSTQKSNTLIEMELEYKTGITPVWTATGSLDFSLIKTVRPELIVKMTYEHDANAVALKADWRAETARLVRLSFPGSTVATPGTTYSTKMLILDMAGKFKKFEPMGEVDGNDVLKAEFHARYNVSDATYATFTVVNELSSLP
jgi:hypothetical protein